MQSGLRSVRPLHWRHYPQVIRDYWCSIDWDVKLNWKLDLPVGGLPIHELLWLMDVPVWPDGSGNPYRVTPDKALEAPTTLAWCGGYQTAFA